MILVPIRVILHTTILPLDITYVALIFPITYLLSYLLKENIFILIYNIVTIIVSLLFVLRIKVPKPRLVSSIILLISALVVTGIYLFV